MTDAIQKAREALVAAREAMSDSEDFGVFIAVIAKIDAALAALDAETEVKVRELEWSAVDLGKYLTKAGYEANSQIGKFLILSYATDVWSAYFDDWLIGTANTRKGAEGTCNAIFSDRIRSALVPPESRS